MLDNLASQRVLEKNGFERIGVALKGDSYRLKDKDLGSPPPAKTAALG